MIPLNPAQLVAQNDPWMQGSQPSIPFFQLIRSLFLRTGGASGIPFTVGANLAAAGVNQATALALVNDFNEITSGSGGVSLDALQAGQFQWVYNGLGGNVNVYPARNGQINALTVNSAFVLGSGKTQMFWCPKLLGTGAPFYRTITLG